MVVRTVQAYDCQQVQKGTSYARQRDQFSQRYHLARLSEGAGF